MLEKSFVIGLIASFGLLLRWCTSLHSYSGENKPEMYGDYEAQRHWMELTVNLPIKTWYEETTDNNLTYWGLDYPPLTAYHSLINGKMAELINKDFVELKKSRGYESYDHKFFMRLTSFISDLTIFITSVVYFCTKLSTSKKGLHKTSTPVNIFIHMTVMLIYPGCILIDHGHFQYNSISLGLTILATAFLLDDKYVLAAISFVSAVNYKQMSLYHALPFFVYMLSQCLPWFNKLNYVNSVKRLSKIGVTVIFTFLVIWFPFLSLKETLLQVVNRLFPLARGVFEDKVANVWCTVNVIYKIKLIFTNLQMAKICLLTTLLSIIPAHIILLLKPNMERFLLAQIISSLGFFLFSFQVHEKSVLLVAVPILMYMPYDPFPCFWFTIVSVYSMLPLLIKDGLITCFISLSIVYYILVNLLIDFNLIYNKLRHYFNVYKCVFNFSLFICLILLLLSTQVQPPSQYPDLWPLLISVTSCGQFCLFFLYFNYKLILSAGLV